MRRHLLFYKLIIITCQVFIITSCASLHHKSLLLSPNPWADDYRFVAGLKNFKQWGTYNVHDPACIKVGDTYYMVSTDVIYGWNPHVGDSSGVSVGHIQVRKSRDLVHWIFVGWAFKEIPDEAVKWVRNNSDGQGATTIWAPYLIKVGEVYRLYYCVSAFGTRNSYIGLAESSSPLGPWVQKGCVERTNNKTLMNAIDPTIVTDHRNGNSWMIYGSFFGGIYCVQLDPDTGMPLTPDDRGHVVARRANYKKENLEAAEVIYNKQLRKYFMFVSYGPLMTTYNVRVGRSDRPEGPYMDFFGKNMADTTDNYPILTAPYRFEHHPGWAGVGHCGVFNDGDNQYFMVHQGRLSPDNRLMDLHVRPLFFTNDGWPVVSPERYTGEELTGGFKATKLLGKWEIIRVRESSFSRDIEVGQAKAPLLNEKEVNSSFRETFAADGSLWGAQSGSWVYNPLIHSISLTLGNEEINNLIVFLGHDWENQCSTILFTGLDSQGRSVWGKRIE